MRVINAADLVIGRVASVVAKALLNGEEVAVVNAEEGVISGTRVSVLARYKERRARKSIVNPVRHGPFFPRKPDGIVKRAVRGMLPYRKAKGRKALKALKVYIGIPKELEGKKMETVEGAHVSKLKVPRYMKLKELSVLLGSKAV